MTKITKLLLIVIAFSMVAIPCFAVNREPTWPGEEGKTVLGNLGLTGDVQGAPSYVEMVGSDGSSIYYLWIDSAGNLRIASPLAVSYTLSGIVVGGESPAFLGATPAQVKWEDASGQIVGKQ